LVVSQGTMLGGAGRSWMVPVFLLNGNFPDGFPQDEDSVPVDGNPHPVNGDVQPGNVAGFRGGSMISMELVTMSMLTLV
jgi:hypothetical protein